jgi:DNA polymerase III delta prime subunit
MPSGIFWRCQLSNEFLWVEKYRPERVEDVILPAELKATFLKFQKDGDCPNLLLAGPKGMGKTSVAKALVRGIGSDLFFINGSLERNIDTVRERVAQFVSTVSFTGGRKFVMIDEADGLNVLTQPALKAFMEEFSHNAGFILTANHLPKVIPELQSRCSVIDFKIPTSEKAGMAMAFMKRVEEILTAEGVSFERKAIAALIQKWFPDWRRVLNELQRYSTKGAIDSGVLATLSDTSIDELTGYMKKNDFSSVRKWVAENADSSTQAVLRSFYDKMSGMFTSSSIPEIALVIGKYNFQAAFAIDHEINLSAALLEIMAGAQWK